jgi:hypothetical protein
MCQEIRLLYKFIPNILRYFYFVVFGGFVFSNELAAQSVPCASELILKEFERIGIIYENGDNNHPVIKSINEYTKVHSKAAYCGSTIGWICHNAGIEVQGMPVSMMPLASNWAKQGEEVWHHSKGWKTIKHTPECDEIFVMLFRWSSNHVEIALQFHGGLNFIDGAGNTSNSKVRKKPFEKSDLTKSKNKAGVYIPSTKRIEGIYVYKERYRTMGLIKILKFKVKFYDAQR